MKVDVSIVLFGSRLSGTAKPDSDFDVFLQGEDFAHNVVPQPMPHGETDFYQPSFGVVAHHQAKRQWSLELWDRLGGEAGVQRFRQAAANKLRDEHPDVRPELIDLFLHIPHSLCPPVYAIRLEWTDVHAHIDFGFSAVHAIAGDDPQVRQQLSEIVHRRTSFERKAEDIEQYHAELGGEPIGDAYREYSSLIEMRRGTPGHKQYGHLVEPMDQD